MGNKSLEVVLDRNSEDFEDGCGWMLVECI
jgi:hypothetical protein